MMTQTATCVALQLVEDAELAQLVEGLCRKNDLRTGAPLQSLFLIRQCRKFETRILSVLAHRLYQQLP